jgi:CubicO group peptidase (beta-lactamase class C family)
MTQTNGECDERFESLKRAFIENFEEGLELGASFAASYKGETVVDLWAGYADRKKSRDWKSDTLVRVFSSTKIPTIICVLIAIDRGMLELDTPVAHYWPEFGAHGKDRITVRDALTHRSLVPGFDKPQPWDVVLDWNRMASLIAEEKPWFEPGTLCYHAHTYGHLLGELVQRASGKPFQQFFMEELTGPLNADFHIGITNEADFERLAEMLFAVPDDIFESAPIADRILWSIEPPPPRLSHEYFAASVPGSNGVGNARSLLRFGTLMAMGGTLHGRQYLSRELVQEAATEQVHDICPVENDLHLGLGFGLDGTYFPAPLPNSFHWGGYGGSWCVMDIESGFAAAYVMNHCTMVLNELDPRQARIWDAIATTVGSL